MQCQNCDMSLLHTLHNTPWLGRLALVWFALTLGVAVASPIVNPQQELVICSSASMVKFTVHADGSLGTEPSNEAQCPLCVVGSAAPPAFAALQPAPMPAQTGVQPGVATLVIAASTAAPPPSRGPPVFH
jgi:hypothetical protein